MERTRSFKTSQLCFLFSAQGAEIPKGSFCQGISKGDGPKGDSQAQRPSQHFVGYTYCPWCGKSGQNEGTIVNHLRMVHYKLGLICDQCFGCPTTMLQALSTNMATSPVQIRVLPPRRVLSLSPHGVCLGDFIVTDTPPFLRKVTILDMGEGVDHHPSNSIL